VKRLMQRYEEMELPDLRFQFLYLAHCPVMAMLVGVDYAIDVCGKPATTLLNAEFKVALAKETLSNAFRVMVAPKIKQTIGIMRGKEMAKDFRP
jgi:hypothetical protein